MYSRHALAALTAGALLAACSSDPDLPQPAASAQADEPRGERVARFTPAGSEHAWEASLDDLEAYWLIYPAGPAAHMGHSHVISVESGRLRSEEDGTRFVLELPARELVVDDLDLRSELGGDFESPPSQADIDGTRDNMLGEDLLDAQRHPVLRISGPVPAAESGETTLQTEVELAGRAVSVGFPLTVEMQGDELVISGEHRLMHEDLGLRPFSVFMGALRVAEEIDFHYRLRARRADAD